MAIEQPPRFIAYDYLCGEPILVDQEAGTLAFYKANLYGQLYNLRSPEYIVVDAARKQGLILRTNSNGYADSCRVIDRYVYAHMMSLEEQSQCGSRLRIDDKMIVETDSFHEAVKAMCEWSFDHGVHSGRDNEDGRDRTSMLQYSMDFLEENPATPTTTPQAKSYGER